MSPSWLNYLPRVLRDQLNTNPLLRKLVGNTGWLFADRVLRLGLGLVVSVWISRYLGPVQFGLYSYLLAMVALFAPIATLGLDNIVIRELVAHPSSARQTLGSAFVLRLMGSLITVMLAVLVIGILKPGNQDEQILVGIIAAGMVFQAFDVCDLWFQAQTSAQYTVYAKSPAFLIASALKVWLILSHASLSAFVWVALIEVVMGVVGSLLIFWRNVMPITTWQLHLATCRKLLSTSWPLMLSGIAIMIYVKIDLVMLTQMQGATATGLYAAAVRISEVWYFIPMAIIASVTPTIVATKHEDEQRYYHRLERLFTLMARLALALALPISLLAYPLITLLFGSAYSAAAPILAIHIWSAVFVFLGVAQSPWDIAEDLTKLALYRTLGGAVINIALNLILIPSLAATGAAIATAISYACSGWILNLCYRQSRPIFLMQTRALIPFGDRLFRRVIRG